MKRKNLYRRLGIFFDRMAHFQPPTRWKVINYEIATFFWKRAEK